MTKRALGLVGTVSCLALALAGCGSGAPGSNGGSDGGRPQVVASFYPFAWVTQRVGGDLVDVENLVSPGSEPHDLELTPRQVADVQDADLVVYETGFQAAVDQAVETGEVADDRRLDVADVVDLVPAAAGDEHGDHEHSDPEHSDPEHSDPEHSDHEHSDDADHDHGGVDPHVWLDPANMAAITRAVVTRLSDADPDHATTYEQNGAALTRDLTELDTAFSQGLEQCRSRDIVTSHAAFGYLARAYDLRQVPIAGLEPGNEPSASQLAEITELVRDDNITTIFTEELVSPAIAQTVARETGATTATLSPIEGLTDETADETYLTLMQQNLAAIEKANRCS